jgi:hypothetical protein
MLRLLCIALAFAVTGCASRAYVTPVEGPRATIKYRLVSPVPQASVFALADGKCARRRWIGGLKGEPLTYEKLLNKPFDPAKAELSATIAANRPFHTEVFMDISNVTYCGISWTFQPDDAASYEADVTYAGEKCDVKLYRIEPDSGATPRRTELQSPPASCT